MKISLGCGEEIEDPKEWVNVDLIPVTSDVVVHDLNNYPWPFEDESAEYIKAKDLIEHILPGTIVTFMEECYRILKEGGKLWVQTPSWDADFLWIDPTHVRGFDIRSMDFFDPETDFGRSGGFITKAKFKVTAKELENKNLQFEMRKI